MKLRLALLLPWALVAVLGVALLQSQHAQSAHQRTVEKLSRQQAELRYELKVSTQQASTLSQQAATLDRELGSAKIRTTATATKHDALSQDLTATKQELAEREQRELALINELAALRQPASAPIPGHPSSDANQARIAVLETQLVELLTRALVAPPPAPAPADPQIVRLGPQAAFVIIDYGSAQGARPNEIILLQRGTSVLAQAQISDIRPQFSVAQVQPTSVKGQLQTGDLVVFTR